MFETIKQLIKSHFNTDNFYHQNTWNLSLLSGINDHMFALTDPIGREKIITEANEQFRLSKKAIENLNTKPIFDFCTKNTTKYIFQMHE